MADISKIKLPTGTTYNIKDAVARATLAGAIKIKGTTTTALTDNATTNPIKINNADLNNADYTAVANDAVFYGNKEFVFDGTNWHEFGDMSGVGNMGKVDQGTVTIKPKGTNSSSSVSFAAHTYDNVLGENTTFTNSSSSVSFGNHTKATVLTSSITATVPKTSSTTKYLTVTPTNPAPVKTTGPAVTDLGDPTTDTFVKSYPGATSKLNTTTVIGVGSSTTTASKATAGTAVSVAKVGSATTVADGAVKKTNGNPDTIPTPDEGGTAVDSNALMYRATVSNETLEFNFIKLNTKSITPAASNGTITPYTFTDVTVPIKNSSSTTVATGGLSANGGGSSVMTGLGTATTASAVTGYTPSTETFLKDISIGNPTVTLNSSSTTSTGAISYISAVGTSGTNAVTFDTTTSGKTAQAITALGAGTAAAQTITVGTTDTVAAITALGAATAAKQTFTGTQETYDVNPKTS